MSTSTLLEQPVQPRHTVRTRGVSRTFACVVLMLAAMGVGGCDAVRNTPLASAQLRIIDAAPGAGSIDAYTGGSGLAYNLQFGTVTSYIPVSPTAHALSMRGSGDRGVLSTVHASLSRSQQYTMLVREASGGLQSVLLVDQAQPAPIGQASVRFVNESTKSEAIDLYMLPRGESLASATPVAQGLAVGGVTRYQNLRAGTYRLVAMPSGTPLSSLANDGSAKVAEVLSGTSARTFVLLDQPLPGAATGVQVLTAMDYDPLSAG